MQRLYYYNHTNYSIGGMVYSLNDIEHGVLRGNQKPHTSYRRVFHRDDPRLQSAVVVWDPRIQFALCRGTRSCPPLQVRLATGPHNPLQEQYSADQPLCFLSRRMVSDARMIARGFCTRV